MNLDTAVFTKLKEIATVGNVYNQIAPQNTTLPYLVFNTISELPQNTHDGFGDLTRSRIQVSVFAEGYEEAKGIINDVLTVMISSTYTVHFIMPEYPVNMDGWAKVQIAFNVNELDFYEEKNKVFHCPLDFFVWHSL